MESNNEIRQKMKDVLKVLEDFDITELENSETSDLLSSEGCPEGQLLKDLRNYKGISQVEMAQALGITQPTLSTHERRKTVNSETIEKYLKELDLISLEDFKRLSNWLMVLNMDFKTFLNSESKTIGDKLNEIRVEIVVSDVNDLIKSIVRNLSELDLDDLSMICKMSERMVKGPIRKRKKP